MGLESWPSLASPTNRRSAPIHFKFRIEDTFCKLDNNSTPLGAILKQFPSLIISS
jgi:hypothetical protein